MAKRLALLALACGCWALPALADDTSDDVKCLAVSLNMSAAQDPDEQSVGMLSTMYWLGRLDGRTPTLDLEKQMDAVGGMKDEELKAEAVRCAAALSTRGDALSKLGESMRQKRDAN